MAGRLSEARPPILSIPSTQSRLGDTMPLADLLGKALDALTGRDQQNRNVRPPSEDPYGDPADQGYQNTGQYPGGVMPASQDPFGDPADQGANQAGFGSVLP